MLLLTLLDFALAGAPATVLDHRLDVRVDYGQRLTSTQTWTVRIDDPDACVAGLLAPPGMDGAMDGGALIVQDLLIVPQGTEPGDTFTLVATRRAGRDRHSGIFQSAPELPIEHVEVSVGAQGSQPLTVWADPSGDPVWSSRRGRSAVVTWDDVPAGETAHLVWSTWDDWLDAGQDLERTVSRLQATKAELGRDLAGDLGSTNLSEIVRRTLQGVALDPAARGGFEQARPAAVVAQAGSGTAAERAVVLISMLRAAGYEARPARGRRASEAGDLPIVVPSPQMLDVPLVQVRDHGGKVLWIDPGSDAVATPAIPSVLVGATVWAPGELPSRPVSPGVADGTVVLTTTAKVTPEGDVAWSTDISADGTGLQAIRELLNPLDEAGQQAALERLVKQSRPDLERFNVAASGTIDPFKRFSLGVSGYDEGVFSPFGAGMRGTFRPVLAPAMAAWLPPNVRVLEIVDLSPPGAFSVAAHDRPGPAYDPSAQVDRIARRNGNRLRFDVNAIRPYTRTSPTLESQAASSLGEAATVGIETLLFPPTNRAVVASLGSVELSDARLAALQALLWYRADDDKQARKTLKKASKKVDPADLVAALAGWVPPGDERPWRALHDLALDPADRVRIVEALEHTEPALALELARPLTQAADPVLATRALLVAMRTAPAQDLRNGLAGRLKDVPDAALVQEARLRVAAFDIDQGQDAAKATSELAPDSPLARMVLLAVPARTLPREALLAQVDQLRSEAPSDAEVSARGAVLLQKAGLNGPALHAALDAARLGYDRPALWLLAADAASRAGNLHLALESARRASDLEPTAAEAARAYHHLAVLARDAEAEEVARGRAPGLERPTWPPSLDDLMGIAAQHELLAALQFHDADVTDSPVHLALRAQLRADAGLRDDAARDSIDLERLHGDQQGRALAFAATVGRVFGSGLLSLLDDVSDPTARLVRLDYRLITTSGDARADARLLREEPRGQAVLQALGAPDKAAASTKGWPADLQDVRLPAPRGYRTNPVLSAAKGVSAWSHVDRQLAVVVVNAETDVLPPPLTTLFTPSRPPLSVTDGVEVFRLRDGYVPLFAARRMADGRTVYGLGFTPEAARRALSDAP